MRLCVVIVKPWESLDLQMFQKMQRKHCQGFGIQPKWSWGKRLSSKSHLVKRSVCQLHERRSQITTVDDMYDKWLFAQWIVFSMQVNAGSFAAHLPPLHHLGLTIFSLNYPWMPLDWLLREQIQCHNPQQKRLSNKSHLVKRSVCQLHARRLQIKMRLQPPYGPSVDSLCHPCITTICIFIVACFCGTSGIICKR